MAILLRFRQFDLTVSKNLQWATAVVPSYKRNLLQSEHESIKCPTTFDCQRHIKQKTHSATNSHKKDDDMMMDNITPVKTPMFNLPTFNNYHCRGGHAICSVHFDQGGLHFHWHLLVIGLWISYSTYFHNILWHMNHTKNC